MTGRPPRVLALMLAGGLTALQNTVIVASLPFLVIIAGLAVSFWMELRTDTRAANASVQTVEPVDKPTAQK